MLPSAQTRDKSSVSPEQMKKLVEQMREDFDYIILDCPAGIEQGFQNAVAGADRALIVTTPEVAAIPGCGSDHRSFRVSADRAYGFDRQSSSL